MAASAVARISRNPLHRARSPRNDPAAMLKTGGLQLSVETERRLHVSEFVHRSPLDIIRLAYYVLDVIRSWSDSATRRFADSGKGNFPGLDRELAVRRLNMPDSAVSLQEISPLKSVGLHKLKGDRKGQWAITVNGPWRICFRFRSSDAYDVELTDYHRG